MKKSINAALGLCVVVLCAGAAIAGHVNFLGVNLEAWA